MSETMHEHYREDTFTITATGFAAPLTGVARYVRHGHIVHLYLPTLSGTSNATTFTLTGIPLQAMPSHDAIHAARITDNGTAAMGIATMAAKSGTITLAATAAGGAFTGSGTKAVANQVLTYLSVP